MLALRATRPSSFGDISKSAKPAAIFDRPFPTCFDSVSTRADYSEADLLEMAFALKYRIGGSLLLKDGFWENVVVDSGQAFALTA